MADGCVWFSFGCLPLTEHPCTLAWPFIARAACTRPTRAATNPLILLITVSLANTAGAEGGPSIHTRQHTCLYIFQGPRSSFSAPSVP